MLACVTSSLGLSVPSDLHARLAPDVFPQGSMTGGPRAQLGIPLYGVFYRARECHCAVGPCASHGWDIQLVGEGHPASGHDGTPVDMFSCLSEWPMSFTLCWGISYTWAGYAHVADSRCVCRVYDLDLRVGVHVCC